MENRVSMNEENIKELQHYVQQLLEDEAKEEYKKFVQKEIGLFKIEVGTMFNTLSGLAQSIHSQDTTLNKQVAKMEADLEALKDKDISSYTDISLDLQTVETNLAELQKRMDKQEQAITESFNHIGSELRKLDQKISEQIEIDLALSDIAKKEQANAMKLKEIVEELQNKSDKDSLWYRINELESYNKYIKADIEKLIEKVDTESNFLSLARDDILEVKNLIICSKCGADLINQAKRGSEEEPCGECYLKGLLKDQEVE